MTIMKSPSVHLKQFAVDDSQDQAGEPVIVAGHTGDNTPHFGPVFARDAPPQRVDEHFLRETFRKGFLLLFQDCLQLRCALSRSAWLLRDRASRPEQRALSPIQEQDARWLHTQIAFAGRYSCRCPVAYKP